jgi:ketosteroid isomerase-like protein
MTTPTLERSPDEQARIDIIERAMEHWHRRELDAYFTLYRPDATLHHTHGDFDLAGAHRDYHALFEAIPDAIVEFQHVLVEGDLVAMTFTLTGTTDGRPVTRQGLSMLRFDGLHCIERWTSTH